MRLRWRHLPLHPNPIHVRPLANVKVDAPAVAWSLAKERSMEVEVASTDVTRTDQYYEGFKLEGVQPQAAIFVLTELEPPVIGSLALLVAVVALFNIDYALSGAPDVKACFI
ncbi:hypothetical protein U9M48_002373 [Paspalum notatum var. saurae]|uniref:Uncharacterized protein n=1 Tax=Paspalum notatum var. saurae TaxID=547442 RepID=A0AAQ3SG08_PASNO